jgi:hypothetical protein
VSIMRFISRHFESCALNLCQVDVTTHDKNGDKAERNAKFCEVYAPPLQKRFHVKFTCVLTSFLTEMGSYSIRVNTNIQIVSLIILFYSPTSVSEHGPK